MTTSMAPQSFSSSAPTTPSTRRRPRIPAAPSPACRCWTVWNADHVIVFKRSMASGYAGVQNPLFFRENTQMLFGDAKDRVDAINSALSVNEKVYAAESASGGEAAVTFVPRSSF